MTMNPLWWSPTRGLVTMRDGIWWRIEDHQISLRHDGFPNALPLDAVRLVPERESEMEKRIRELCDLAEEHGFEFDRSTGRGRLKFVHPNGAVVIASTTGRDYRTDRNFESQLKRGAAGEVMEQGDEDDE